MTGVKDQPRMFEKTNGWFTWKYPQTQKGETSIQTHQFLGFYSLVFWGVSLVISTYNSQFKKDLLIF